MQIDKQKRELENENKREIGRERENDDVLGLISGRNCSSICSGMEREREESEWRRTEEEDDVGSAVLIFPWQFCNNGV